MTTAEPWSQDAIAQQHDLLEMHRRTLQHYLSQQAALGSAHMPPGVAQGITEARANIARIKATLRARSAPVHDHPDDEQFSDTEHGQTSAGGAPHASAGDTIDARDSQGFVNHPTGPVTQHFGEQRTVNTGGGDYAEGNVDKRQGAFINGGTIYGPVVGTNTGTITTAYGNPAPASTPAMLEQALARVQQAAQQARQRGDSDGADDLDGVAQVLGAALKAQREGKGARRAATLHEAQAALRQIAAAQPEAEEVARMVERVQ